MNRREFLALLGFGAAAIAVPGLAVEKIPTLTTSLYGGIVGRVEAFKISETEAVMIGDYFTCTAEGEALEFCRQEVLRFARMIVGHDNIETFVLPKSLADKSDPLGQVSAIGWKARNPVVGWRERWANGLPSDMADHANDLVIEEVA